MAHFKLYFMTRFKVFFFYRPFYTSKYKVEKFESKACDLVCLNGVENRIFLLS